MSKAKIVRNKSTLMVVLANGSVMRNTNCTDALFSQVLNAENDEEIISLLSPKAAEVIEKKKEIEDLNTKIKKSKILTEFHDSVYWKDVCELSMPKNLIQAVLKAEQDNDKELIQTYKNFWTLCSLNPDSRARLNLFGFLQHYDMVISKSGLFVAYRSVLIKDRMPVKTETKKVLKTIQVEVEKEVEVKKEVSVSQDNSLNAFISSEFARVRFKLKKSAKVFFVGYTEENGTKIYHCNKNKDKVGTVVGDLYSLYHSLSTANVEEVIEKKIVKVLEDREVEVEETVEVPDHVTVYTDNHTKSMNILIGQPVSIDRKDCNPNQNETCTKGLHVASKKWIDSNNYFGNVSLLTLINPADVVAVPPGDSYGKMRVCSYFPVAVLDRDSSGNIIHFELEDGFDDDFVKIIVDGYKKNNDDEDKAYTLEIPPMYEIDRNKVIKNLEKIKSNIKTKIIK